MADSGSYTPETIARRLEIAKSLLGDPKRPVTHWAQGLDELAKGYFGGKIYSEAENAEKGNAAAQTAALMGMLGGSPSAAPVSAPASDAPPPQMDASNLPRGLRNNNPLNIEAGSFTQGQPGFAGSDGRFARFDTPEAGVGAANKLLDTYQNKYGLNTPAGIVGRWAPAGDGNNVSAYAANVARQLGIGPNDPVPPEMRPQLIAAMGQHENGRPIGDVASALGQTQMAQAAPQGGGDTKSQIVRMLSDPNPAVQRMGRQLATGVIQKQIGENAPTNDIKEYNMAKQQGFTGTLLDYQTKLKEAGKPVTNINQQQESEYQKATGKHFADLNNQIATGALKARGEVATLNKLGTLLADPNIYQGKGGETILELTRLAKAAGFDVGDLGGAEAVRAIQNQFALELRNPSGGAGMPGAMSDRDREFLQSIPPGLEKTREGNLQIGEYRKKVAQRSIDVDRLRQQYVKKNGRLDEGFYQELAKFSDANPLFPEAGNAAPAAPSGDLPAGWSVQVK